MFGGSLNEERRALEAFRHHPVDLGFVRLSQGLSQSDPRVVYQDVQYRFAIVLLRGILELCPAFVCGLLSARQITSDRYGIKSCASIS